MFQVDDDFLDSLGLQSLAGAEREEFKRYLRSTLQERVGERLTEGMSDDTLDEFGLFMDGNVAGMKQWLDRHLPGYENSQDFIEFQRNNAGASESDILSSYGSLAWLQVNRPDYPDVVRDTMEELRQEIISNRDAILGR